MRNDRRSQVDFTQVLWFILSFESSCRYLCLHQRSSCPPREWKTRNGQDSDPLPAVGRRKTSFFLKQISAFREKVDRGGGGRKGIGAYWAVEKRGVEAPVR